MVTEFHENVYNQIMNAVFCTILLLYFIGGLLSVVHFEQAQNWVIYV